jgi:hypothetical protein
MDGGRGGIRTPGTVSRTPDFESGAFNHSATLPYAPIRCSQRNQNLLRDYCDPILARVESQCAEAIYSAAEIAIRKFFSVRSKRYMFCPNTNRGQADSQVTQNQEAGRCQIEIGRS